MREFTIDRAIWARGSSIDFFNHMLTFDDKSMCCVGVYLNACGMTDDQLRTIGNAHEFQIEDVPEEARWLLTELELDVQDVARRTHGDSLDAQALYEANDEPEPKDVDEDLIAEVFARHDIRVTITGTGHPFQEDIDNG